MSSRSVNGHKSRSHFIRLALLEFDNPGTASNALVAMKAKGLFRKETGMAIEISPNMVSACRCDMRLKYGAVTHDACRAMNAGTTTFLAGADRSAAEKAPPATVSSPISCLPPASFAPGAASGSELGDQATDDTWEPTTAQLWAAKNFADSVGGVPNAVTTLNVLDTLRK